MNQSYDLTVIGSGPAGQAASELAAYMGSRVLMVEQHQPGGAVTTTGGVPTKTLREAALYLSGFRQEEIYGVSSRVPLATALPIIAGRVGQVRSSLQEFILRQILDRGVSFMHGSACVGPDNTVVVTRNGAGDQVLETGAILVATGSHPYHSPGIPFDDPDVYDTDRIGSIRSVPSSLAIIGGGAVGVELASVFTALDLPVTIISQSERLIPSSDGEMAGLLADEFQHRGMRIMLGCGVKKVVRRNAELCITLSTGAEWHDPAVLVAAGRVANSNGLGLEEAGVEMDLRGRIIVDRYQRSTAAGIYAAGDVVGGGLASIAMQQGRVAASHALGHLVGTTSDQISSSAVYGIPEVSGVGATEEQVIESGTPYIAGRSDLAMTPRGAIAGHGGRLKLIVQADTRRLLGVHCIGDIASEIVGLGHAIMHGGGTVEQLLQLTLNTPTYAYAYHYAALDALTQLRAMMREPFKLTR